jgi:antitoxin CptB
MDLTNDIMKRLKIQSWRRGMKEMDLILGRFIDTSGHLLSSDEILKYELLLLQDDQEIFAWFSKQTKTPTDFVDIISKITNSTTSQKL